MILLYLSTILNSGFLLVMEYFYFYLSKGLLLSHLESTSRLNDKIRAWDIWMKCVYHKGLSFPSNFSSEYLQANGHDSLRVLALHEMGNLQFYNENTRLESVGCVCVCVCVCVEASLQPFGVCIYLNLHSKSL